MNPLSRFIQNYLRTQRAAKEGCMDRRQFLRACVLSGAALPVIGQIDLGRLTETRWVSNAEMIRALGRKDARTVEVIEAFAAFIAPTILQVIDGQPTFRSLLSLKPLEDSAPLIIPVYA
ncbi:MAG: hypothetical protein WCV82_04395 [Candidatus Paceibacterota bacterium]|jgi:hypothetical protein